MVQEKIDEDIIGNDGHDESGVRIKGPIIDTSELRREDGLLARAGPNTQSLLHRAISAIGDNKDYRQELKTALFATSDEADLAVSALDECFTLGMDPTPIINQMIGRSAGHNHDLLYRALDTLTHTSFTTNYQKGDNRFDKRKSNSPLS